MYEQLSPDGRYRVEFGVTRSKTDIFDDDTYYEVRVDDVESNERLETYFYCHLQSAAGTRGEQLRGVTISDDSKTLTIHLLGAEDQTVELDSLRLAYHQEVHPDGDLHFKWAEKIRMFQGSLFLSYKTKLYSASTGAEYYVSLLNSIRLKDPDQRTDKCIARMTFSRLDGFLIYIRRDDSFELFLYDRQLPDAIGSQYKTSENGWFAGKIISGHPGPTSPPDLPYDPVDLLLIWDIGGPTDPLIFSDFDPPSGKFVEGYNGRRLVDFRFAPRNHVVLIFDDGTEEQHLIDHPRIITEDAIESPCGRFLADRIETTGPHGETTRMITIRFARAEDGRIVKDFRHWWTLEGWTGEPRPAFELCAFDHEGDPQTDPRFRIVLRDGSVQKVSLKGCI